MRILPRRRRSSLDTSPMRPVSSFLKCAHARGGGRSSLWALHQRFSSVDLHAVTVADHDDTASSPKTPLVLMHGLLGSQSNLRSLGVNKQISADRKVVTADLRNHGNSPHVDSMDFSHMSEDVLRLLDKLDIDKAILLGHSLGGKIAMVTGLRHSDRISGLIVADVSPVNYSTNTFSSANEIQRIFEALLDIDLSTIKDRKDVLEILKPKFPALGLRQFLAQNLVRTPDGPSLHKFGWRVNLETLHREYDDMMAFGYDDFESKPFQNPTAFIGGSDSRYITPDHHETIRQLFPKASIESIDGAGHWLHADKPQEFAKAVSNFLVTNEI